MLGIIIFILLILLETGFMILSLIKKSNLKKEKYIARIALFTIYILLVISPIITWSFRWILMGLFLGIQALAGILILIGKKEKTSFKKRKVILVGFCRGLVIWIAVLPVLLFPQNNPILPTGDYTVGTVSYTWTDESREEYFTQEADNRNVTVQFWYPSNQAGQEGLAIEGAQIASEGKYPLVIFSHGAYGFRGSNKSTYIELASHGYIVCSIDHTYHAFITKQENGKSILVDRGFLNEVNKTQSGTDNAEETYEMGQKWLKLRKDDMAFVMDYIKKMETLAGEKTLFQSIDLEHIGVFGHSLGGATAAQIGREEEEVDAVIVIDGTMMGEITDLEDGKELILKVPYPKPIMIMYNESHYNDALKYQDDYANMIVYKDALDPYQVIIKGSGHLNFTDLPLFSPFLARQLGTGDVDARSCIKTMNEAILQFFDYYLKSSNVEIHKERVY